MTYREKFVEETGHRRLTENTYSDYIIWLEQRLASAEAERDEWRRMHKDESHKHNETMDENGKLRQECEELKDKLARCALGDEGFDG